MSEQTLSVASVFPDGTEVALHDAQGYPTFPESGGPPGSPLQVQTVAGGQVTFTELTANHPYFAAAKLDGRWRYVAFTHAATNPDYWGPKPGPQGPQGPPGPEGPPGPPGEGSENFAVAVYDSKAEAWPERPESEVVMWMGPKSAGDPEERQDIDLRLEWEV